MDWIETVKQWLVTNERSQSWLARKSKMDQSYLNALLQRSRNPGDKVLGRLNFAMDLPPGTLRRLALGEMVK